MEEIKKPNPLKIPDPDEDDPDPEDKKTLTQNQITIGDVSILSFSSIPKCEKTLIKLLQNPIIKNYLGVYQNKKMFGGVAYVG